jgi:hypothetical protein
MFLVGRVLRSLAGAGDNTNVNQNDGKTGGAQQGQEHSETGEKCHSAAKKWAKLPPRLLASSILVFTGGLELSRVQRVCKHWKLEPDAIERCCRVAYAADYPDSPVAVMDGDKTSWLTRYKQRTMIEKQVLSY